MEEDQRLPGRRAQGVHDARQTIDDHIQSSTKVGPSIAEDMIRALPGTLLRSLAWGSISCSDSVDGDSRWVRWRVGSGRLP